MIRGSGRGGSGRGAQREWRQGLCGGGVCKVANRKANGAPERTSEPGVGVIAGKGLLLARQRAQRLGALARWLWRLLGRFWRARCRSFWP